MEWFINNKYLYLIILEARKSKVKVLETDALCGETPFSYHRWHLLMLSLHVGRAAQALLVLQDQGPHPILVGGAAMTYSSSKEPTS